METMDEDEPIQSRTVEVIETRQGVNLRYFTTTGIFIGELRAGQRVKPQPEIKEKQHFSGIIKSYTPAQIRRQKEREAAKLTDPKSRIKHLKEDVA